MISKKLDVKMVSLESTKALNLCESTPPAKDMVINYTYTDQGRQLMILDIGAPVSEAGIPWMMQNLDEFDLGIENMKSESCNQPFVFGPSKRYISNTVVELPIQVTRMDSTDDVLIVKTYLVVCECGIYLIWFLC